MWRALAPYIVLLFVLTNGAMVAYMNGGPAWLVHLAAIVGALIMAPAVVRYERRREG